MKQTFEFGKTAKVSFEYGVYEMSMKPKIKLEKMTLADHAEAWTREQGKEVPERDTPEWEVMYEAWIDYAFADFPVPPLCGDSLY